MSYAIGLKAIRRLCIQQSSIEWFKSKLNPALFKPNELPVYEWVDAHVKKHHALPQLATLQQAFPVVGDMQTDEPASYYVQELEQAYFYQQISQANQDSTNVLKTDQTAWRKALQVQKDLIGRVTQQMYRTQVLNFGVEAPQLIKQAYFNAGTVENVSGFGWPYMDDLGGAMPGDIVSFIGRPQAGKSFMTLYTARHNWLVRRHNVLFVSMEMAHLPIAQRLATMIAGTNLTQLKGGMYKGYATPTMKKFMDSMAQITGDAEQPGAPQMYIVNGNLAANMEEIFALADQFQCQTVLIDGAYLCRHANPRLDRFTRAAENCELMKRFGEDLGVATFSSWQFNREAVKKDKKKAGGGTSDSAGLEDIGYSDAIGQISSTVLGLFQDDGVEAMITKKIRVLKGRGGEVGDFEINWDFDSMNFDQVGKAAQGDSEPIYEVDEEFV